ncbi:hypothetical protein [Thalassotalea castellviae]|uniref:Uncharacterized protein n=1 Tax=Thalassotalea castellviae TaxID=3075612 RepID=A0ABU3A0T9_9GAMM|nr:hypothetical protein [Thalassotalea sp. W431]MDT0603483.1 hypothetical protein [Thalassotalea sp. W431]
MSINQLLNTKSGMIITAAGVGAIVLYFAEKKLRAAAGEVGQAVNPLNNDNIFASGVNSVGASITGNQNWSLGGSIYELFNGTSEELLNQKQTELTNVAINTGTGINPNADKLVM